MKNQHFTCSENMGTVVVCVILLPFILEVAECSGNGIKMRDSACPFRCNCESDDILQRVDCAYLGLTVLPANLSVFTSFLDLSMNNLSTLPASALSNLHFLQELRLAGNGLTHIPRGAFSGLFSLKVLMLQNNRLTQIPSEALQSLRNLQSLRLDANHISVVPPGCFEGLTALRHLWLDDNMLTHVPVQALASLTSLQAVTFALNRISHIPDYAFANLSSLVVLHLHNNQISSLGEKCFDGLQSLETLDLNYNGLSEFPIAIRALTNLKELAFHSNSIQAIPEHAFIGNPSLLAIFFYNNPIKFVGKSAFQNLPELRTLSLNGATELSEFPNLTGTHNLESLAVTGASITSLPSSFCEMLANLQVLDLSYNQIRHLPSFSGCGRMQKIDMNHNEIQEVLADTFQDLSMLRSLDLAWNRLRSVDPLAFSYLPSLIKLDMTSNELTSLPELGLPALTHLRLAGNEALRQLLSPHKFPSLRVLEVPYAFQCCAFLSCEKRDFGDMKEMSGYRRKDTGIMSNQEEQEFGEFFLELEENHKPVHSIQCSPAPGPFQPCDHLFGSWLIRSSVWAIVLLSVVCNAMLLLTIFLSAAIKSSAKQLVGLLALANLLTGLCSGALAMADALTFAEYGALWESGVGCKLVAFLSVLSTEASVFLLTAVTVEQGFLLCRLKAVDAGRAPRKTRLVAVLCVLLAATVASLPLVRVGEYGANSLCLPMPTGESSGAVFSVTVVLLNSLCYFVMTVTHVRLYCLHQGKGPSEADCLDCCWVKHTARLLFANCLLFFPVAFLSFAGLLNFAFVSAEVVKSIALVVVPLPACMNPLLYMLLNPHFREDLSGLCSLKGSRLVGVDLDTAEKSCNSTQSLVTETSEVPASAWPSQQSLACTAERCPLSHC
ncbi:hypothetical protein AALO_G00149530 [Alosa alosa]|uniref:G-protein coupled receptors family 1 profile domain-containing protein n=1 Tax=Alosa alosa TaxID=278164 RepID=A0AAV6GGX3_9TELE|nr:leucine-rich repeat-containing G-protein coupled receptor 5-like isoform X1 [Alosa alosa]KAG5273272.1 hypothetical protein AALO_G00149530 [Alosa alosa]